MSGVQIPLPRPKELAKGQLRSANRIAGGKHGLLRTSHLAVRTSALALRTSPFTLRTLACGCPIQRGCAPRLHLRRRRRPWSAGACSRFRSARDTHAVSQGRPLGPTLSEARGEPAIVACCTESGSKLPQSKAASPRCRSSSIQTSVGSSDSDLAPVEERCPDLLETIPLSASGGRSLQNRSHAAATVTNDGTHTYQYDAEKRLIKIDGGSTGQYACGPQGERVSKIAGGVTTYFYWGIGEKVNGSWTRLHRTVSGSWIGDGLGGEDVIRARLNGGNGEITPTPRNTASCDVLSVPGRLGQGPSREIPAARRGPFSETATASQSP
jgi:hypothetical protein